MEKLISTLIVSLCFSISYTQPQPPLERFEEEFVFENHICVTPQERKRIKKMLSKNIDGLKKEGKLEVDPQKSIVFFNWVMAASPSLDYYNYYAVSNNVDHDMSGGVQDYNCGNRVYDGHRGTDYFTWPFSWYLYNNDLVSAVAGVAGTIIGKDDGNADDHCACSGSWNAVYIEHSDGSRAWYGHLKSGSLTSKSVGESVALGEYLGIIASSGCSTGPHLHLEVYDNASNLIDPYQGPCNSFNANSWWVSQPGYTEPQVNAVKTHSNPPVIGCPAANEMPNFEDNFSPGQTIYFATYYRDLSVGDMSTFRIRRPNNSIFYEWDHVSTNGGNANSLWWTLTLPVTGPFGSWTFETDYMGQTYSHSFNYSGVVAVELVEFNSRLIHQNKVGLDWEVSDSPDIIGFEIEHSTNTSQWDVLDFIPSKVSTRNYHQYTYHHTNPDIGINYYRLKILLNQGDIHYSIVVSEQVQKSIEFSLWPNPVTGQILHIDGLKDQNFSITVLDYSGKILIRQNHVKDVLDLGSLPTGVYYVWIVSEESKIIQKIVKL